MYKIFLIFITASLLLAGVMSPAFTADFTPVDGGQAEAKRIHPRDVKALIDKGQTVLIVDVRSASSYRQRHIEGAMSVPLSNVEAHLSMLPQETQIVFY